MNRISGIVMIAGSRAAFSSARIMRSLRNSAESTRSAEASGVPYFSVWIIVVTTPLTASRSTRWARFSNRSEEHTSELQSLMRISYAVFCLKKKKTTKKDQIDISYNYKKIHTYNKYTNNISTNTYTQNNKPKSTKNQT